MAFYQPSMNYFVVFEHDHRNRAVALAPSQNQIVTQPPRTITPSIDTLTLFGHGVPGSLCGLNAKDMSDHIKQWKSLNKKLDTIEILTCNSRHAETGTDAFVKQLRSKLGFRYRSLKIMAMPIRMGAGGGSGDSILFADYKSKTWCYVTASRSNTLGFMKTLFKRICEDKFNDNAIEAALYLSNPPPKTADEGVAINPFTKYETDIGKIQENANMCAWMSVQAGHPFQDQLINALEDPAFRREFISKRKYTMNYGGFDQLRKQLAEVK